MNKVEDVKVGTTWHANGSPDKWIVVVNVYESDEERRKWGGDVAYRYGGQGATMAAWRRDVVTWGVLSHDFSNTAMQPKGMLACGRCCELWPMAAKAPGECKPTTDPRPPQVIIEEKVAALMARGG